MTGKAYRIPLFAVSQNLCNATRHYRRELLASERGGSRDARGQMKVLIIGAKDKGGRVVADVDMAVDGWTRKRCSSCVTSVIGAGFGTRPIRGRV